jgi:hypothetical protein
MIADSREMLAPMFDASVLEQTTDRYIGLAMRAKRQAQGDLIPAKPQEPVAVIMTLVPEERHLPDGQTAFTGNLVETLFLADEKMLKSLVDISVGAEQNVYRYALDAVQVARFSNRDLGPPVLDAADYKARQDAPNLTM